MVDELEGVHGFSWVRDGRLAGMAWPRASAWRSLADAGLGAVLSLTLAPPPGDPGAAGLAWRHHPIRDFGVPAPEAFDATWAWATTEMEAGRPLVVHCRAGMGRTGMVLAAFLAADGTDPTSAVRRVRRLRPGSIETHDQELFVAAFAARHAGRVDEASPGGVSAAGEDGSGEEGAGT